MDGGDNTIAFYIFPAVRLFYYARCNFAAGTAGQCSDKTNYLHFLSILRPRGDMDLLSLGPFDTWHFGRLPGTFPSMLCLSLRRFTSGHSSPSSSPRAIGCPSADHALGTSVLCRKPAEEHLCRSIGSPPPRSMVAGASYDDYLKLGCPDLLRR